MQIRQMTDLYKSEYGFTMLELLIAMMMSGVVAVAIFVSTGMQQDVFEDQGQAVAAQDNLRASMLIMGGDIRMAGYDQTGLANASITVATANTLSLTMDKNSDGDIIDAGENITYGLYVAADGVQKLGRQNPNLNMPVAENINNLEFYYTMADGTLMTNPAILTNIRSVQVTVLAITANQTSNSSGQTVFTTPSGVVWNIAAGFRGRMQTSTFNCRNMGL